VKHRDESLRELYADDDAPADGSPGGGGEATLRDGSSTITLREEVREAPSLYGERDLKAAVRKESYGFQDSGSGPDDGDDSRGAVSLPSYDSDDESFRLCDLADTISRK
jgi:hypothetical protein